MGIIAWIVLGGIAGWLASIIMKNNENQGMLGNIVVGIIGGLLGGFIMSMLGGSDVNGFNLYSLLVAVGGACLVLLIWNAMRGGNKGAK